MKDSVFQQLMKPLSSRLMQACVSRFHSDYAYEKFKTYEHLQTMLYVDLNQISSLRSLEVSINNHCIGLTTKVCRSTLSDANRKRQADCFLWLLEQLLVLLPRKKKAEFGKVVRLLDSSPIQLKGHGYEWAKAHATQRSEGLKLHVEYDLGLQAPIRVRLSSPNVNDSSMGKVWPIESGTVYVFDKGYCDYNWWWHIQQQGAFFVSRLKTNAAVKIEQVLETQQDSSILQDTLIRFTN
ncbi:IS4 family transposase [Legionella sp. CNM-1927-20]|uniref:IS4 family transposase n=1 Tax=Legionella sp. CNM-1927-20 TaxID=3422221 RepID=UPI00403B368B